MTREQIQQRLNELNAQKEQIIANYNCVIGAMQELNLFLEKLNAVQSTQGES